jgi:phosphate starvation-inducible PhoH-like protein
MVRDRVKEESDFEELTSINSTQHIHEIKTRVKRLIPKDTKIIAKNDSQKDLIQSIRKNEITICAGPAGTGKTYVALALALSLLRKEGNRFKTIYLVKSIKTLKDEELGFLKGELKDKIDPAMWSFYINIEKMIMKNTLSSLVMEDIIRPFPLSYIRGSSLDDCIIIADEMQNVTFDNSRTLLTRIGSNSKLIVLGDINQIDLKNKSESSLRVLLELFDGISNIGVVRMSEADTNIRNPLINVIEKQYNDYILTHITNGNGLSNGNGKKQQLND